ncbi:MAG: hypothetical protein Kow0065_19490 [Methylomicrobium sp.]
MKIIKLALIAVTLGILTSGCSARQKVVATVPPAQEIPPAKTLSSIGYGTVNREQQYRLTPTQRKLMAIRASKMDALRALTEQVYGVSIDGHTTVEEMAIKNDSYRVFVNAFLRGARVNSTVSIDRDTYETVMELDLTPTFYRCVMGVGSCTYQAQPTPPTYTYPAPPSQTIAPPAVNYGPLSLNCNSLDCYPYPKTKGFGRQDDESKPSLISRFTL